MQFEFASAFLAPSETPVTVGHSEIATTYGASLIGDIAGTVVLNGQGRAVAVSVPALGAHAFVPATFLERLADRVIDSKSGQHGWLQLEGTAAAGGGVRVVGVTYRGVAWDRVHPHDTIVAIDGVRVRTVAEIGSILYARAGPGPRAARRARRRMRLSTSPSPPPRRLGP